MAEFKRIHQLKLPMGVLDVSARDEQLLAACMDGVYEVSRADSSRTRVDTHTSYVSSIAHVPGKSLALSAGYDGALHWWDTNDKQRKRRIQLHDFWSWDMKVAPNGGIAASVTGQYLAGGYKYEPLPEREPSLRLVDIESGEVLHSLAHVPSVQAVAFSPDSQFVAAGNIMGEVRVWNCDSGQLQSKWTTPDFTSWGIIKSHSYVGGIFALQFTPDGAELLLAGMGPMRDPMAGNGKQRWQKWSWRGEPVKVAEIQKQRSGEGLMEALATHPDRADFVMAGRLRGGKWNVALFDLQSGAQTAALKTGYRVTSAVFNESGDQLILGGANGQGRPKGDSFDDFGRIEFYEV